MRTYREAIEAEMRRRRAPRAKAAEAPHWNERPMAMAFVGAIALMLLANLLLNILPG